MTSELPLGLKELVGNALELLGKAILLEYGQKTFDTVESYRQTFKKARDADITQSLKTYQESILNIRKLDSKMRYHVAHSFAISLELINACENAYRTFRLKQKTLKDEPSEDRLTFVLTAHPTESRSPECIELFTKLTHFFIRVFEGSANINQHEAFHLILLFLKTPVARNKKPEVSDEAEYIYSISLRKDILRTLIDMLRNKETVFVRTWVGGDKDGHPGIDAKVMKQSLTLSREMLVDFTADTLKKALHDLQLVPAHYSSKLAKKFEAQLKILQKLKKIERGDGKRIAKFHKDLKALEKSYVAMVKTDSPYILDVKDLLFMFPGLVVTLELRENMVVIYEVLKKRKGAIWNMLKELRVLSAGGSARWYVRGFVTSHTESATDIKTAAKLVKAALGSLEIPVIPLFEDEDALKGSRKILEELFDNPEFLAYCHKDWDSRFEVMLGYSDSAKESGSLASRMMIHNALFDLEECIQSRKLIPIFFHGSGGSVARGGGSLEEQVSWWPLSSRKIFKVTIQGEMVYRSFAMPEIFRSQVQKILHNSKSISAKVEPEPYLEPIESFSEKVSKEYQKLINDPDFLHLIEKSTPYGYLNELRIGSRPAKRSAGLSIKSLRAIPWVLCWTQMRSLLPIWWGIGSTWTALSSSEKEALQKSFHNSTFFTSFVKLLAFSMAKVNLAIWFTYLHHSKLSDGVKAKYQNLFEKEFEATIRFIKEVTGESDILWFRPWLATSIRLRSTMINPMNMTQLVALESSDHILLRETVTGIASGMLTTG